MEYGYTEEGKGFYVDFRNYRNGGTVMHSAYVWLHNGREAKRPGIPAFMGRVHCRSSERRGKGKMGRSGVISQRYAGEENERYHDVAALFKIYRSVNWRMQVKVNQVKHRIQREYGTDIDTFLDSIYQAGMDINQDLADMKERIEAINRSNKFLKLIDEAVDLMRKFHPQGERYYWVLYYSYMSAYKAENIEEILDKLEPHFTKITRIHRATYFRWREQAFEAVGGILWGYEEESRRIMEYFKNNYEPD